MFAFILSFIFIFAEGGHETGGFTEYWNTYLNYPGFELWRFINLGIFIAVMYYFLKRPLTEKFKAKREAIRADLIRAEEEKQAALARLTSAEAKLVGLEPERNSIVEKAKQEAAAERARIAEAAEAEAKKIREQAASEAARLAQQTRADLRRFSAEESIRLAEEKLRTQINAERDSRLVKSGIEAIGGLS
jgi:F0F1-type ATP synthase membrane subunit b/b'